jgi:hypothetical protein
MHYRASLLALALATAVSSSAFAQAAAPASPYKVLFVGREAVKPGKGDAHDKVESEWARSLAAAKMPYGFLALRAMTGARETWFMSGFPSYAEYTRMEKAFGALPTLAAIGTRLDPQEADVVSDARSMVLVQREDLSYGAMPNLPQMRYYTITRVSVRPGHVAEFEESRKLAKQAHETAKVADNYAVYQATAGAPSGTFFVIFPRKSMAELDDAEKLHGPAYVAALGGEDGQKKMAALTANFMISSQSDHYAFIPSQSVVGPAWASQDPTYWKHQTTPPAP